MLRISVLLVTAAVALAGCGSPAVPATANGLAEYLPRDTRLTTIVDVDQARDENSLAKDADAFAFNLRPKVEDDKNARLRRLGLAVSVAFRPLYVAMGQGRPDLPLLKAFDGSAISAAASNAAADGKLVTAIRTTQSFDAIADKLKAAGFKGDGDTVVNSRSADLARVTKAGDDVVLLTGRNVDAGALADDPPGGPRKIAALIERPNKAPAGSLRIVLFAPDPGCVAAFAGDERASQGGGMIRLRIAGGAPREEAINLRAFDPEVELAKPFIFKQVIESGYNVPRTTHFTRPLFDMLSTQRYRDVYRCQ